MKILWKGTVSAQFRAICTKLCGNCVFPQNFHTIKLGEITVFFLVLRNSFQLSEEGRGEKVCILFSMYSITFLVFAFLIWRCARCFHGTFSQINICHFSGEALPLAFAYFALVSLLVPTACKTFCSRKWNSMLVSAAEQLFSQTEFLLNQPPLNLLGIIWLSQLQSKFSIMDP